ncbi:serine/threonine-protein kinase [Planctellipticum variicoloris]|uniref:serine/threonine-protein kinase n=1 Tax=Planctellipticum variicoloris TaxID=3064265 RepID=UPI003013BB10|nr:serine/threonine protein kinase [Planctomycetaceae bacterium SH412]
MSDTSPPQSAIPATARPEVDPQSVEGLFLTVLAMDSPAERAAFLDQVCGDDAPRRRRIEALLRAYDDAGSFLEHPATPVGTADNFDFLEPADKAGCIGRLGYYEVIDVIGRGGMGIVFRALDPRLNRIVAIKVLAPELAANPLARRRFLREAQAAAAVSHPHVVTIHAVDEAKLPYLVMECIVGQSLQQKLDQVGPLRLTEILRIGSQIAEGLAAAHRQGLIHRDIKPANILLENGVERVKITDFGLARAADDAAITRTGEVSGTPQYMSPEQAHGDKVDPRSDLFSLGCVLYAMCTGRSPFRADSVAAAIRRVCDDTPRPIAEINAEIPAWLIDLVDILLAKQPEDRFQTADEVAVALEKCLVRVQRPGDSSPPTASRIKEPRRMAANAAVAPSSYGLSDVTYASGTAAIILFLGQVLFAGAFGLVGGLEILSCSFDLPDPKLFMARLSGALGAIFLLSTVGLWLNPATSGGRSVALTIATRFAIFYAMWFGLFTSVVVIGEWNTQEDEPLLVVLGVVGLSIVAATAFLLGRATSSGTEPATEPRKAGRQLALLGIGVWALLLTWFLGIAIGVLRPPRFESPLHTAAGPLGIGLVWAGGLLLAAGMFLQNRILGAAHWLYVLRIVGLGALMVGGLLAILSLLYFFGEAISPSPVELTIVLVVVALAIVMYRRIGRMPLTTGGTAADATRRETPARPNRNWLWTALIVFSVVCVAPCLLGVAYLSLSYSTVEVQRMPGATTPQISAAPSDAAGAHDGGGAAMMGMPGMAGDMSGMMGSPGGTIDESQWGAILLDFGTAQRSPASALPGGMMGMPGMAVGAFSYSTDRAVRLRPTDTVPGRISEKDAHVRKEGELVYRAHPLTDPGIYRIAPGEYEVQLFDWSYGWALGRDVAETAPRTPVAPQRPAAMRSLGTIRVQTGEIVTVSATRDDVTGLIRGILATTPDMHETQLAQFLWNGEMFVLSPQQAKVVRYLLQRSAAGEVETTEAELRTGAGQQLTFIRKSDSGEPETQIVPVDTPIEQIFNNGRHPAWGTLIVPGTQVGTFALGPLKLPQGTVPAVAVPEKEPEDLPADATLPELKLDDAR